MMMENKEETLWRIARLQTDTIERQQAELHRKDEYISTLEKELVEANNEKMALSESNERMAGEIIIKDSNIFALKEEVKTFMTELLRMREKENTGNNNPLYPQQS